MKAAAVAGVIVVLASALLHAAHAQFVIPSGQVPRRQPPAAQHCIACHGAQGEGNPDTGPRIAGQPQYYLARQLDSYADGSRRHPGMEAMAKLLSPEDRTAFATYYAQLDAPVPRSAGAAPPPERGRVLATIGNAERRVQACDSCHGPGGIGEPPASPYLAGLDADYIVAAMNAWRDGTRRNDAGQQMATIAKAMPPDDVAAVARYYASLPPPKAWPLHIVRPVLQKRSTGGAPSSSGPVTETRAKGVGVEQRAPMTGGTHGTGATDASKGAPEIGGLAGGAVLQNVPLGPGDPVRGRAIIASGVHGCTACHAIPGIRTARGVVGPPLGGLARRAFIAGQLPNNQGVLVAFLQNPPALAPRTGMPDVGLTLEEARHIAAFLYTLERAGAP
jgi:cytochrome c553